MKKLLTLSLVSTLLLTLVACGQTPADTTIELKPSEAPQIVVTDPATEENETPDTPTVTEPEATQPETPAPETTQPQEEATTKAPETTKKPATTKTPETTKKPTTTKKPAHKHSYTTTTKKATCTANGKKIYTCSCGDTYSKTLKATGHKWGDWAIQTAPTTTTKGQDVRVCATCSTRETKATGKLISQNSHVNHNNNFYDPGAVSIRPKALYWSEDGYLYAECFIVNGCDSTVSDIVVKKLSFIVNGKTVATSENLGKVEGVSIESHKHVIWGFRFSPSEIADFGADLSGYLEYNSAVSFN